MPYETSNGTLFPGPSSDIWSRKFKIQKFKANSTVRCRPLHSSLDRSSRSGPHFIFFLQPRGLIFEPLQQPLPSTTHLNSSKSTNSGPRSLKTTQNQLRMASREAYQVPSQQAPAIARDSFGGTGALGEGPAINYLCGDCNAKIPLKKGDPIRCKECGHRVLYKERTKR